MRSRAFFCHPFVYFSLLSLRLAALREECCWFGPLFCIGKVNHQLFMARRQYASRTANLVPKHIYN